MEFISTTNEKVYYETTEGSFTNEENECYIVYGIRAYKFHDEEKVELDEIDDISDDYDFVKRLTATFNREDLRIEHFRDVVYDALI